MSKLKKWFTSLFCFMFIILGAFTFAACGNKDEGTPDEEPTKTAEEVKAENIDLLFNTLSNGISSYDAPPTGFALNIKVGDDDNLMLSANMKLGMSQGIAGYLKLEGSAVQMAYQMAMSSMNSLNPEEDNNENQVEPTAVKLDEEVDGMENLNFDFIEIYIENGDAYILLGKNVPATETEEATVEYVQKIYINLETVSDLIGGFMGGNEIIDEGQDESIDNENAQNLAIAFDEQTADEDQGFDPIGIMEGLDYDSIFTQAKTLFTENNEYGVYVNLKNMNVTTNNNETTIVATLNFDFQGLIAKMQQQTSQSQPTGFEIESIANTAITMLPTIINGDYVFTLKFSSEKLTMLKIEGGLNIPSMSGTDSMPTFNRTTFAVQLDAPATLVVPTLNLTQDEKAEFLDLGEFIQQIMNMGEENTEIEG